MLLVQLSYEQKNETVKVSIHYMLLVQIYAIPVTYINPLVSIHYMLLVQTSNFSL